MRERSSRVSPLRDRRNGSSRLRARRDWNPAVTQGLDIIEPKPAAAPLDLAERIVSAVNRLVVRLSSVALVIASFVLTYSVIVRYFLKISTDWQDEMSVFLIIGAVFMSAAAIQAARGHVAIEAITGLLPPHVNMVRQILVDAASLAFCAFFAWKSWLLLAEAWEEGFHSGSTWAPPLWIPYVLMTAGMMLLSLQILLQLMHGLARGGVSR
jgi:TRAP-type C4-dicarboxylate transport system permease small subunit